MDSRSALRQGSRRRNAQEEPSSSPEGDLREQQGRFSREEWQGAAHMLPTYLYDEATPRLLSTPRASAYIKIAEGCDHPCTFCVIPESARQVPLAALRIRRRRSAAACRQRRAGDHAHRPGHHLLRRRPGPEGRARHYCSMRSRRSKACAGCASCTRIPTASPAVARHHRASTTTSANILTCRCSTRRPMCSSA